MNKNTVVIGIATFATAFNMSGAVALANPGTAGHQHIYQANLTSLNKSGDKGNSTVTLTTNGDGTFTVKTTGVSAGLPHAQHIHIGGKNTCPDPSADKDKDGLINTTEGQPAYGPLEISLTTSGDMSKESALAVERFPVADAKGTISYERTYPLPDGVTEEMLSKGVIVQHGISELFDDKAKYDGAKKSEINNAETLPLEATVPSLCGKLQAMPVGGAGTGEGGAAESKGTYALAIGTAAIIASGAIYVSQRRSTASL